MSFSTISSTTWIWIIAVAAVIVIAAIVLGLVLVRRRRINLRESEPDQVTGKPPQKTSGNYSAGGGFNLAPGGTKEAEPAEPPAKPVETEPAHPVEDRTEVDGQPGIGDDAAVPRDSPQRGVVDVGLPEDTTTDEKTTTGQPSSASAEPAAETETPAAEEKAAPHAPAAASTAPTQPEATAEPKQPEPEQAEPAPAEPEPAQSAVAEPEAAEPAEEIASTDRRLEKLRGRLSRSRSAFGQGLLGLLGAGDLDEDSWTDVEDTLLMADIGSATTMEVVDSLRETLSAKGVRTADEARGVLRSVLIDKLGPDMDRAVHALPHAGGPGVVLVAGVNGTGKTTTTGKLARVLVGQGRKVLLGAADTFRAAAADQLETWGSRVGAETVRGKEGGDPAAIAFDAVKRGAEASVDTVLIDTAGRLHTKAGLMDELGKVKRVVEKQAKVDEVLLVLDATTGQNGLMQARVFAEVVDISGIVLTKLDGTAKGGIVFQVQRELGVPVKLVGLGEGADDLAPFEPAAFVDALLMN